MKSQLTEFIKMIALKGLVFAIDMYQKTVCVIVRAATTTSALLRQPIGAVAGSQREFYP